MKFLKFFLFTAAILTVAACSSDDDSSTPVLELNNTNLAGSYDITYYVGSSESSITASDGSTVVTETETYSGDTFTNAVIAFNADGTFSITGSYRETYTTTVTGQDPETDSEIVTLDEAGSYTTNNTSRTITFDGEDILDVIVFDGTNLTLRGSFMETFEGVTYKDEFEYRAVKQN